MTLSSGLQQVLAAYPPELQPQKITPLGSAGGFSGAGFWKLEARRGPLCLRRWPREHPNQSRLHYIHAVLRHVSSRGFHPIPVPLATRSGESFVEHGGCLWELTPWLPGQPDEAARPSDPRLQQALRMLATFHLAAASFSPQQSEPACSPGLLERARQLRDLLHQGGANVASAVRSRQLPAFQQRAQRVIALFSAAAPGILPAVDQAARTPLRLQPCIRDIRPEHVLFSGDEVSGLIDFGAIRDDNVAVDVARLLGGMVGDDPYGWRVGLQSYQTIRPLDQTERELVRLFDQTTVLLSGMNWLQWLYVDRRRFENPDWIFTRLDALLERLARLCAPSD